MMAFSLGDGDDGGLNEINLVPLIDIMLVLMIIFLVTASVAKPSVLLNLPKTGAPTQTTPPKAINISIDATGQIFVDNQATTLEALEKTLMTQDPNDPPPIYLRADKEGKYDTVAQVLALASAANLGKIAFVNDNK